MAENMIEINYAELTNAGNRITSEKDRYQKESDQLLSDVKAIKGKSWEGEDAQKFITAFTKYAELFPKMKKFLEDTASYITEYGKQMKKAEQGRFK